MIETIQNIINIPIIPVILLPVTGLLALVFYNRAGAINQRIRLLQRERKEVHFLEEKKREEKWEEANEILKKEICKLHIRANLIGVSIVCCLLAVVLFSLCALFVAFALFFPKAVFIALFFWFIGPVLICIGSLSGIVEMGFSLRTIKMQTLLLDKWEKSDRV